MTTLFVFLLQRLAKTPPTGYNEQLNMMYSYTGDCSSVAAQMAVKTNLVMLCGGKCKIEDVKVNCGAANVVSRRKRRNAQQLTIKVTIKVTTTAEKAALVLLIITCLFNFLIVCAVALRLSRSADS